MQDEAGLAAPSLPSRAGGAEGFTLIEMLVALLLLSLVGITLARFQTFQLGGAATLSAAAAARLEADNRAIDLLVAANAPGEPVGGAAVNGGRTWHWQAESGPSPDPVALPDLVVINIAVSATPGGPPLARRQILRPRKSPEIGSGARP